MSSYSTHVQLEQVMSNRVSLHTADTTSAKTRSPAMDYFEPYTCYRLDGSDNLETAAFVEVALKPKKGIKIRALISPQSNVSIVDKKTLIEHRLFQHMEIDGEGTIISRPRSSASPGDLDAIGTVILNFNMGQFALSHCFYVVHSISPKVVLGEDFLSALDLKMDLKGGRLRYKNVWVRLTNEHGDGVLDGVVELHKDERQALEDDPSLANRPLPQLPAELAAKDDDYDDADDMADSPDSAADYLFDLVDVPSLKPKATETATTAATATAAVPAEVADKRPFLPFRIRGRSTYSALLSTGSAVSAISVRVLEDTNMLGMVDFAALEFDEPNIRGVGSILLFFKIDNFNLLTRFYVVEGLEEDAVLGSDFVNNFVARIDHTLNVVWWKRDEPAPFSKWLQGPLVL